FQLPIAPTTVRPVTTANPCIRSPARHPPFPKCRTSAHPRTSHTRGRPLPASPPRPRHRLSPVRAHFPNPPHFPNPRPPHCSSRPVPHPPRPRALPARPFRPASILLPRPPPVRRHARLLPSRRCVLSARPSRLAPSRVLPRPSRPASTCACSAPPSPSRHAGPAALQLHRGRAFSRRRTRVRCARTVPPSSRPHHRFRSSTHSPPLRFPLPRLHLACASTAQALTPPLLYLPRCLPPLHYPFRTLFPHPPSTPHISPL
ncbi:hypothetical protein B0H14DRAFT_3739730, partial [Mycena olivaceomarginata]